VQVGVVDGAATRELRRAVLRPGWPVGSPMHGDDNADAVHIAAVEDDGTVVGACLVLPRPYPVRPDEPGAWQLRGMATASQRQGRGIGTLVIDAAITEVRKRDARLVWCDARTAAVAFYRRHGFRSEGAEFLHAESGIPHYRMWRALPSD
jgi:ribosomal protein S18 acetylase RimI-like enzyme